MSRRLLISLLFIICMFTACSHSEISTVSSEEASESYSSFSNKIWIADTYDFHDYPSFYITSISNNTISGKISTYGRIAIPYCYVSSFADDAYIDFSGTINDDGSAVCFFEDTNDGDKGSLTLIFKDNAIKADIQFERFKYPDRKNFSGLYELKPYNLADYEEEFSSQNTIPINLERWGEVVIFYGYTSGNHPLAITYITDENKNILYKFTGITNGIEIKSVEIDDYNNDDLSDIKLNTDYSEISYIYIQQEDGLFYDSKLDSDPNISNLATLP